MLVLALRAASSRFTRTFSCTYAYAYVVRVKQPGEIRFQFNLAESIQFTQGNTDHITSNSAVDSKVSCRMGEREVGRLHRFLLRINANRFCQRRLMAVQTISLTKRKSFQSTDCKGIVQILPSAIRQKTDARANSAAAAKVGTKTTGQCHVTFAEIWTCQGSVRIQMYHQLS